MGLLDSSHGRWCGNEVVSPKGYRLGVSLLCWRTVHRGCLWMRRMRDGWIEALVKMNNPAQRTRPRLAFGTWLLVVLGGTWFVSSAPESLSRHSNAETHVEELLNRLVIWLAVLALTSGWLGAATYRSPVDVRELHQRSLHRRGHISLFIFAGVLIGIVCQFATCGLLSIVSK